MTPIIRVAPSFGADIMVVMTKKAPSNPPHQSHHGIDVDVEKDGRGTRKTISATIIATKPDEKLIKVLNKGPVVRPARPEFKAACNGKIAPARRLKKQINRIHVGLPKMLETLWCLNCHANPMLVALSLYLVICNLTVHGIRFLKT